MLSVLLLCAVLGLPIEIDNVLRAHDSSLEILGLAAVHPLDRDIIKRAHRTRVQLCHPDHHCHGASFATCAAAYRATMLLNNARDDLLSKWQEPVRPWEATAPSAPWEEPPPSWAGLGVCLTCLACLGSLDCLARFSKRHARRPDPTQSESAGYRWLSLTCSCLARTWPFLWSVLTLLVAPVVSVYGMWMWVSDKRQRAQRAATVRASEDAQVLRRGSSRSARRLLWAKCGLDFAPPKPMTRQEVAPAAWAAQTRLTLHLRSSKPKLGPTLEKKSSVLRRQSRKQQRYIVRLSGSCSWKHCEPRRLQRWPNCSSSRPKAPHKLQME